MNTCIFPVEEVMELTSLLEAINIRFLGLQTLAGEIVFNNKNDTTLSIGQLIASLDCVHDLSFSLQTPIENKIKELEKAIANSSKKTPESSL